MFSSFLYQYRGFESALLSVCLYLSSVAHHSFCRHRQSPLFYSLPSLSQSTSVKKTFQLLLSKCLRRESSASLLHHVSPWFQYLPVVDVVLSHRHSLPTFQTRRYLVLPIRKRTWGLKKHLSLRHSLYRFISVYAHILIASRCCIEDANLRRVHLRG